MNRKWNKRRTAGFTLVELLVVIGIIALLVSILMPSLARARRAANAVACLSTLRQSSLAMTMYVSENKGAIPGSAWTSAAFLYTPAGAAIGNDGNCPIVSQTFDWMAPLAKMMGIKFEEGGNITQRGTRFAYLNQHPVFQCAGLGADTLMPPYSGSPVQVTSKQISMVSSFLFQVRKGPTNDERYVTSDRIDLGGYYPKITKIGASSEKIFLADGSRWVNNLTEAPDYNLGWNNSGSSPGAQYAEYGPWINESFSRTYLKDNPRKGSVAWVRSMRHGAQKAGQPLGDYRMNVVYFDGHAETLDGFAARNPHLWMPRGTSLPSSQANSDTVADYFKGQDPLIIK